jgi:hypothetical protein
MCLPPPKSACAILWFLSLACANPSCNLACVAALRDWDRAYVRSGVDTVEKVIFTSSAMASSRSGTSSTLAVLKLTRRCSKNRSDDFLDAAPDFRRRAFLHHHSAGHSRTDQHAGWHVRDLDGDRNALCQSHPGECGIDRREELWAILVVIARTVRAE